MNRCQNQVTQKERTTQTGAFATFATIAFLMIALAGCTTLAGSIYPPVERVRTYEIAANLEGFYYAYCKDKTIFGNCKEMGEIFVRFDDKERIKELRDKGFVLSVRSKPF